MLNKAIYSRVVQVLSIGTLIFIGLIVGAPVTSGQAPVWSQPVLLSAPEFSSWFPDIVTDSTGQVHVVWGSGILGTADKSLSQDYNTVVYMTSRDGQEWSEPIDLFAMVQQGGGDEATRPALFIDQRGIFHLTFRYTSVFYSHSALDSVSSVESWPQPRQLSSFQNAYFSRLAGDGQGRLHLVFTENVPGPNCAICFHIFYRHSDDNGLNWSSITDISRLPTGSAKPQILVDKQDNVHIVWEAGEGGAYGQLTNPTKVMYMASYDRGQSWTVPIEFLTPGGIAKNIALGLDGQDRLLVAWLDMSQDLIYYQLSSDLGKTWSPPRPIPGVWGGWSVYQARLDDYAMATDSAGDVHLVIVGRTASDQESLDVLHLRWDRSAWSKPEVIAALKDNVAEWPRIAIGGGNQLHVTWYVRDGASIWGGIGDEDFKPHQVWYARGTSSAPALAPVDLPTRTPTPTPLLTSIPTDESSSLSTPTPLPTLDPDLAEVSMPPGTTASIYTDADDLILLVKSLIPITLVIVLVIASVYFWRR